MHDKALADVTEVVFLPEKRLLPDLGFKGYQLQAAQTLLPIQQPLPCELSEVDKCYNRLLASVSVKVEQVIHQ